MYHRTNCFMNHSRLPSWRGLRVKRAGRSNLEQFGLLCPARFIRSPRHDGRVGATLVELMVSITLTTVLSGILFTVYLAIEQHHHIQSAFNILHDNSTIALQLLTNEIQAAGFIGCPRLTTEFPLNNSTSYSLSAGNALYVSPTADFIILRHRSLSSNYLQESMVNHSILYTSAGTEVKPGNIMLISDCRHADIFKVAEVGKTKKGWQKITTLHPLQFRYKKNSELGRLEVNTYFVANTGRTDERGSFIFSLYVKDIMGHKTELIDGIQKIIFRLYTHHQYHFTEIKLDNINDWTTVSGVSIAVEAHQEPLTKIEYGFAVNDSLKE